MEYSSFFNSENGDRKYLAEDWDRHLKDLIKNGIFGGGTNLQVTADGSAMSVVLQPGKAWINGKHYENTQELTFQIAAADGTLNRIDRIVICLDYGARTIITKVKKGTFASNAAAPDLQRNADKYELCLANISIPAGTSEISQSLITDTRLDTEACGIVTGIVDQVDTTTFYNQIADDLARFRSTSEADFTAWVQSIKDVLDENTAGNLLELIDGLKASKSDRSAVTTASLPASGWTGSAAPYSQTISMEGVTATSANEILPGASISASQLDLLQAANLQDGGQADGSITVRAYGGKPTADLPIRIIIRGDL